MKKDGSWKVYFSDPSRYADAINGFGCNGEQVVHAEDLQEMDTQLVGFRVPEFVNSLKRRKVWGKSKFRDMVRKAAFGVNYIIIGIESQDTLDYSLPLRNLLYDSAEYEKQAAQIRRNVKKNPKGLSTGEYLYGFRKDSKLLPVTTFILYSGSESWQGPTCLHEMLDFTDIPKSLQKMIPNYQINVINIREIEDTSVFKTDLKYVLDFMRCAEDKARLRKLVEENEYYHEMDEDAYDVVTNYANVKELITVRDEYVEEGKADMCKAIKDLMEDSRIEGILEGRLEGRLEGEILGRASGMIVILRKYQVADDEIIQQLVEELEIDEEKAKEYLKNIG